MQEGPKWGEKQKLPDEKRFPRVLEAQLNTVLKPTYTGLKMQTEQVNGNIVYIIGRPDKAALDGISDSRLTITLNKEGASCVLQARSGKEEWHVGIDESPTEVFSDTLMDPLWENLMRE